MDESLADTQPMRRLGDFEIVRELGRGGMGVVHEARQVSLNRKVALKVLSGSLGLTTKAVLRFQREAEAAAKLHHTNIVPIYATGEQDGAHYYAMELIEGPGLDQVISQRLEMQKPAAQQDRPGAVSPSAGTASGTPAPVDWVSRTMNFPPTDAAVGTASDTHGSGSSTLSSGTGYFDTVARMMAEVADALDYAHAQGVIHRDIKPSNLLLAPVGRLSLNDFGLARMLEQPGMTVSGEFVGSPMYMSPEQIAAGRASLDHRTDIYSLGATLYELLTLQPPFPGVRRDQVIAQIIGKEPKPPRPINRRIPQDLETICLKMMEKDPDKRYQTAGSVAEDLRRYVNRFAISARRIGPAGRAIRWAKRSKALAAALVVAMILAMFTGFFAYQAHESRQRVQAEVFDKALGAAMGGDPERVEKAIGEAELAGVSTGQVSLLRGLFNYRTHQLPLAITHLEQALKLMPDSVAARSLLMLAATETGQWDERSQKLMTDLSQRQPKTAEDFLFKGYALSSLDPAESLNAMNQAVSLRDSAIARQLRAGVLAWDALDRSDPEAAEKAIEDSRVARALMADDFFSLFNDLQVQHLAATTFGHAGQDQKRAAALANAERIVASEKIQQWPVPISLFLRSVHYDLLGDDRQLLAVLTRLKGVDLESINQQFMAPILDCAYVMALYRGGQIDRVRELVSKMPLPRPGEIGLGPMAYLVVELPEPEGPARAYECYRLANESHVPTTTTLYPQTILRLLGRKAEAVETSRKLKDRTELWTWRQGWYRHVLAYCCDEITADELLRKAGESTINQCEAHFYIGLTILSQGDRQGARQHFQRSAQTGAYQWVEYMWSRQWLARMDQDPTWPPWIPLQEPATQPTPNPRQ